MKGGEAKFWGRIAPALKNIGHCDRIESHATSLGRPDVNLCIDGYVWDIELKYCDAGKVKLRPAQKHWLLQRSRAHGNCCVLVHVVDNGHSEFLMVWGHVAAQINDNLQSWREAARVTYHDAIEWDDLIGIWINEANPAKHWQTATQ